MSNQTIHCSVGFCRFNEYGERCGLAQIRVTSQAHRVTEQNSAVVAQAAETSCASFESQ